MKRSNEDAVPSPPQRPDARARIVDVATRHFVEIGFDAARIADIRREASVSNGSFFHHFPSKDALGAQVYVEIVRDYQASLMDVLTGPPMAIGTRIAIERLVRRHLAWVVSHREHAAFLFSEGRSDWIQISHDVLDECNERFLEAIEDWRAPRIDAGELVDIDLMEFVAQLLGPAQMLCRQWLSGRDPYGPELAADALVGCAIRALVIR